MEVLTFVTATTAAGLLATSASRLAVAGWRSATATFKANQHRRQNQSELRRQSTHARLAGEANWQVERSASQSWRVVEVVEVADESLDCRSFYLQDPLHAQLPSFLPGQFVLVRPALGAANVPARCYSLSDSPNEAWWRVSVKRQTKMTTAQSIQSVETTGLSQWLHDQIRVGDCLLVSEPMGEFTLNATVRAQSPIVLLSAGIGVTPLMSMLKTLLSENTDRPVTIFQQVQDIEHWPFGATIHSWAEFCTNLNAHSYFSRSSLDQLPEIEHGSAHCGKYSAHDILAQLSSDESTQFFMCGPDAWMRSLESDLVQHGVAVDNIHSESFASSTRSDDQTIQAEWSLEFVRSHVTTEPSTGTSTVWQAARQHGLELPAACHNGVCGSCKLKLLRGSVSYAKKPICRHTSSEVVACVAQAVGNVSVDA